VGQNRKQYSAAFKFKIALEAAKKEKTISQIASENNLHPNQVSNWKKQLLTEGTGLFEKQNSRRQKEQETREAALYEQIGRLKMELEWLKKIADSS
jgi:transposase-like protein